MLVREGRVELPRPFGHRILSPARLPFRHSRSAYPRGSHGGERSRVLVGTPTSEDDDEIQRNGCRLVRPRPGELSRLGCSFDEA